MLIYTYVPKKIIEIMKPKNVSKKELKKTSGNKRMLGSIIWRWHTVSVSGKLASEQH